MRVKSGLLLLSFVIFVTLLSSAREPSDPRAEITAVRYHQHPDFFRIVLQMEKVREYYSAELKNPDRFYLDLYQAKLSPDLQGKNYQLSSSFLKSIQLSQKNSSTVRLSLEFSSNFKSQEKIYYLKNPIRLVIDISNGNPAIKPKTPAPSLSSSKPAASSSSSNALEQPPKAASPSTSGYSLVRQLGLGVRRIVLDPGHGGADPGCISPSGLKEKDVALDLARRLKKILEAQGGFEVILTRDGDFTLPLEKRTALANQKGADLFISIHLNASPRKNRTGVETFYLNFSPDPAVNELAALENASSNKNIREIKQIVEKIIKNSKYEESKDLAEKIHHSLLHQLRQNFGPRDDLGVKGGPFWVLIGSEMPAVLVEASHLSNPKEEEALKTDLYRESIATGLFRGIIEYVKSLGKG
ncbi:MAG: N-acetylmuramoyl-L-alanine amidase [Candidatus Saccharicenans sp.]|nr:MAG: hypothetical protein C0168_00850 [Candidatus Aminicenantes bacterium]HEK85538.1 N-acetylmuramoyl-L-alanine amidase [Candidatus Aminicenantes bacterium]